MGTEPEDDDEPITTISSPGKSDPPLKRRCLGCMEGDVLLNERGYCLNCEDGQ